MPRSLQKLGKRQDWTERRRLRSRLRRGTPPRILPVSKVRLCPRLTLFCPASPPRSNLPSSPPSLPLGALLHSSRPLPPCSSHLPVAPRCRSKGASCPRLTLLCPVSPPQVQSFYLSALASSRRPSPLSPLLASSCSLLASASTSRSEQEEPHRVAARDCSERLTATRERMTWHPSHPSPALVFHSLLASHPSLNFPTVAPRLPLSLTA